MRLLVTFLMILLWHGALTAASPINPDAVAPLTKEHYPKAFAIWGAAGFARINKAMEGAAVAAAKNPKCNKVEMVSYSDARSAPPNDIVVFVDCLNNERLYLTESQALAGTKVHSQSQKASAITKSQAIDICVAGIKKDMMHPQTFKMSALSVSAFVAKTSGNWSVVVPFKAKNSFGAELPQTARCIIPPGEPPDISYQR